MEKFYLDNHRAPKMPEYQEQQPEQTRGLSFPGLRKLKLEMSVIISDASVKRILKNSPRLEVLELTSTVMNITGDCLEKFSGEHLRVLKLSHLSKLEPGKLEVSATDAHES